MEEYTEVYPRNQVKWESSRIFSESRTADHSICEIFCQERENFELMYFVFR